MPESLIAPDCRHYVGDRPCVHDRLCRGCEHYAPYHHRICVIKLAALGDVIRTLCVLPELRRRYPQSHVTWVSHSGACRMIQDHPLIDRVMEFDPNNALVLQQERFDLVVSLDKEAPPCALAQSLTAARRIGVGLSPHGTPIPLNPEAEHYVCLGLSDELKFHRNRKSYPRLVYEALGWRYDGQRYELPLDQARQLEVRRRLVSVGWQPDQPTLGINVGAGDAFANKMWPALRTAQLIRNLRARDADLQILLLGGSQQRGAIDAIVAADPSRSVMDAGTDHDEKTFAALVDACDVVFSGDTMAMHVAIALRRGLVVFFGPTCEQEIDLFGLGEKLIAEVPCAPCYKQVCDGADACVHEGSIAEAADAVQRVMTRRVGTRPQRAPFTLRRAG